MNYEEENEESDRLALLERKLEETRKALEDLEGRFEDVREANNLWSGR